MYAKCQNHPEHSPTCIVLFMFYPIYSAFKMYTIEASTFVNFCQQVPQNYILFINSIKIYVIKVCTIYRNYKNIANAYRIMPITMVFNN